MSRDEALLAELTTVGKRYADALSHRRTAGLLGLLGEVPVAKEP